MKKYFGMFAALLGMTAALIVLAVLVNFTSPNSIGSLGVLIIFILMYLVTFLCSMAIIDFIGLVFRAMQSLKEEDGLRKNDRKLLRRKLIMIVATLNFVPIFLISMNSIGQLSVLSVGILVAIEGLTIFYLLRNFS